MYRRMKRGIAFAGVVLVAGCGSTGGPKTQSGSGALAFSQCMRSNGVAAYPDPDSGGHLVKESLEQLGVSSSRFQSAQSACRHVLPDGGSGPTAAQVQRVKAQALRFSECVRAHG